jgi:hypothetical protein
MPLYKVEWSEVRNFTKVIRAESEQDAKWRALVVEVIPNDGSCGEYDSLFGSPTATELEKEEDNT